MRPNSSSITTPANEYPLLHILNPAINERITIGLSADVPTLDLSGISLSIEDMLILRDALLPFKKVNLSNCNLSTPCAQHLSYVLLHSKELESLDISKNQLGHEGGIKIANALITNTTLKKLNIAHNHIADLGAEVFTSMLTINRATCLSELDLSHNGIHAKSLPLLERAVSKNTSLTCLTLDERHFQPDDLAQLTEIMRKRTSLATQPQQKSIAQLSIQFSFLGKKIQTPSPALSHQRRVKSCDTISKVSEPSDFDFERSCKSAPLLTSPRM